MNRLADLTTWPGRCLVLGCILVLPFLRFLLRNRYPLLSLETAAAVAVLLISVVVLAAVARNTAWFLVLTLACIVLMATVPTVRLLHPAVRLTPLLAAVLLVATLGAAICAMRRNFLSVVVVFSCSAFAVDVSQYLAASGEPRQEAPAQAQHPGRPPFHVIYLVMDEQIGPAGLPEWIPECRWANAALRSSLWNAGFRTYPFAYSNYASTFSSLASLFNRVLLVRRREFSDETSPEWQWGIHSLRENRLLKHYARRGYRIHVHQHQAVDLAPSGAAVNELREYRDELGNLRRAPGDWSQRFRWVVGNYQQSDHVMRRVKGFFPFRFSPRTIGPLALGSSWPQDLLGDMAKAQRHTLFFAHLMTPHFPYLYRRDGSIRDLREWTPDRVDQRSTPAQYEDRYRRYCEQTEFVSRQLEVLFAGLRLHGLYDTALIVVHGDHGSRIRRAQSSTPQASREELPAGSDPEAYDYRGEPPLRDLLDRYSTLLAIKLPGQRFPHEDSRKGSVLRFLSEAVPLDGQAPLGAAADDVYLFDGAGRPQGIRMLEYWK